MNGSVSIRKLPYTKCIDKDTYNDAEREIISFRNTHPTANKQRDWRENSPQEKSRFVCGFLRSTIKQGISTIYLKFRQSKLLSFSSSSNVFCCSRLRCSSRLRASSSSFRRCSCCSNSRFFSLSLANNSSFKRSFSANNSSA
jgi:hypothetical protein